MAPILPGAALHSKLRGCMKFLILLIVGLVFGDGCGRPFTAMESLEVPTETPAKEKKIAMEKEVLANMLDQSNKEIANLVRDPASKLESYGPKIGNGTIVRVSKFAPTRMIVHFVGVVSGEEAIVLTGDKEAFVNFAQRSKTMLNRAEDRIAYGSEFLSIAVAGGNRLRILESVSSIKSRPALNNAQSAMFAEFVAKYTGVIKPPACSGEVCNYYAISGQDLVLFELTVSASGSVKIDETVLEKDILIPYAM